MSVCLLNHLVVVALFYQDPHLPNTWPFVKAPFKCYQNDASIYTTGNRSAPARLSFILGFAERFGITQDMTRALTWGPSGKHLSPRAQVALYWPGLSTTILLYLTMRAPLDCLAV